MKTITFICTGIIALLFSCARDITTNVVSAEDKIALTSPKGFNVASDIKSLREKLSPNAKVAFGEKSFSVVDIKYTETSRQSAAIVEFKSIDGEVGTVLYVGTPGKLMANGRVQQAPPKTIDCNGGCDAKGATCRERIIISPDDTVTYECTCEGTCKMTVSE